jgi:hypothetical protein
MMPQARLSLVTEQLFKARVQLRVIICMYICIYIYIHTHTYTHGLWIVCLFTCTHMHTCTPTYPHTSIQGLEFVLHTSCIQGEDFSFPLPVLRSVGGNVFLRCNFRCMQFSAHTLTCILHACQVYAFNELTCASALDASIIEKSFLVCNVCHIQMYVSMY